MLKRYKLLTVVGILIGTIVLFSANESAAWPEKRDDRRVSLPSPSYQLTGVGGVHICLEMEPEDNQEPPGWPAH